MYSEECDDALSLARNMKDYLIKELQCPGYFGEDDRLPGVNILKEIIEVIERGGCAIVLVDSNFESDAQANYELHNALLKNMGKNNVIPVLLPGVKIPAVMQIFHPIQLTTLQWQLVPRNHKHKLKEAVKQFVDQIPNVQNNTSYLASSGDQDSSSESEGFVVVETSSALDPCEESDTESTCQFDQNSNNNDIEEDCSADECKSDQAPATQGSSNNNPSSNNETLAHPWNNWRQNLPCLARQITYFVHQWYFKSR